MPSGSNGRYTAIDMDTKAILGNYFWGTKTDSQYCPIGLHLPYSSGD
jgi:hypothetical protein